MRNGAVAAAVGRVLLLAGAVGQSRSAAVPVEFDVTDKATGTSVACRIHLLDQAGKPQRAGTLPFWWDHVVCPGSTVFDAAPGDYNYEVERGPEYGLRRQAHGQGPESGQGPGGVGASGGPRRGRLVVRGAARTPATRRY